MLGIAEKLLPWFEQNRRVLPFRQDPTPYHIWISEIMLQQTRMTAAVPYYERFIAELPDPAALAACDPDRLRKLWQGLGYYSRAANLQKAGHPAVRAVRRAAAGQFRRPAGAAGHRGLHGGGDRQHRIRPAGSGGGRQCAAGVCPAVQRRCRCDPAGDQAPVHRPGDGGTARRPAGGLQPGADGAGGAGLSAQRRAAVRPLPRGGTLPRAGRRPGGTAAGEARQKGKAGAPAHRRGGPRAGGRAAAKNAPTEDCWQSCGSHCCGRAPSPGRRSHRIWRLWACRCAVWPPWARPDTCSPHKIWQMQGWLAETDGTALPDRCVWASAEQLETLYSVPSAFAAFRTAMSGGAGWSALPGSGSLRSAPDN